MEGLEARYARLKPGITVYGPDDDTLLPAVVFFHGCGGVRPHIHDYARIAADLGVRAYVVDSFTPRGWGRSFAVSLICTGVVFQGHERAGDVLAVLWGLRQSGRVMMDKVVLSGFSHGGWSIMDLMTAPLKDAGEVGISDPDARLVDGLAGLFLVYPYINFPARSNSRDWVRTPRTFVVLAEKDHLTPYGHSQDVFAKVRAAGAWVEMLELDATHAFDEDSNKGMVMQFSEEAMHQSQAAMVAFLEDALSLTSSYGRAHPTNPPWPGGR